MDIQIIEHIKEKVQVVIKCRQVDGEIIRLRNHIEMFDKKLQAKKDNEWCFVHLPDVLYFESVDNRIFLYQKYSKKQGEIYTKGLRKYQMERSAQHEK